MTFLEDSFRNVETGMVGGDLGGGDRIGSQLCGWRGTENMRQRRIEGQQPRGEVSDPSSCNCSLVSMVDSLTSSLVCYPYQRLHSKICAIHSSSLSSSSSVKNLH